MHRMAIQKGNYDWQIVLAIMLVNKNGKKERTTRRAHQKGLSEWPI